MRYGILFSARDKGAIGIVHNCARTVEADSVKDAILALYDTHDHISLRQLTCRVPYGTSEWGAMVEQGWITETRHPEDGDIATMRLSDERLRARE